MQIIQHVHVPVSDIMRSCVSCLTNQVIVDEIAPGLNAEVNNYKIAVTNGNEQILEQAYLCMSNSEWCSYTWKVTNQGEAIYSVSVAANNLVGQGETTDCTPAPIGELRFVSTYLTGLIPKSHSSFHLLLYRKAVEPCT